MRKRELFAFLLVLNIGAVSAVSSHTVSLESGWNMVSPQVTGLQKSDFQEHCGGELQSGPWWYNPSSGQYVASEALNPFRGYWVRMTGGCEFSYSGQELSDTMQLSPGWNMVSASSESYGIADIESVCGEGSVTGDIWHWDPSTGEYVPAQSVRAGKGYWVEMESSCRFNPETLGSAPPSTPDNHQPTSEPTFELVSVNSARTAIIKVNGDRREVRVGDYLMDISGISYARIDDIVQTDSSNDRGMVVLHYQAYGTSDTERVELSNSQETTDTGETGSTEPASSLTLESVGTTDRFIEAGEKVQFQARVKNGAESDQLVRAVWKLGGEKVGKREQTVETGNTETLARTVQWHYLDYLGLTGDRQLSAEIYRVDEGGQSAAGSKTWGEVTVVETLEPFASYSGGTGTGWTFKERNLKGGSDSLVQTPSSSGTYPLVMDTGPTGYCGFAYLEETYDLSSSRTLTVSYELEHGRAAGEMGVWVNGEARKTVDPEDSSGRESGQWDIELSPGKNDVKIGIKDVGDFCDSSYHTARLEITGISLS